ncbi:MAG TPA: class I SAM-dependent methyltransferase [Anaerolineaceae bacterium]|nr:class I SAM-dependent methyltransferase [Anaerolineaceae bacterium]
MPDPYYDQIGQLFHYNVLMDDATISALLDLNRLFYQKYGRSFAQTRRRIQPGARRLLAQLSTEGDWLDLGCGSGWLAVEWALSAGQRGSYLGLDFSETLLQEARRNTAGLKQDIRFRQADLSEPGWAAGLQPGSFEVVLALAMLHHLPGEELRRQVLKRVRTLLKPQAFFIHSEWQFQHSPKLSARRLPWNLIGLSEADVDPGDAVLDWRAGEAGQGQPALRYVHQFSREELAGLARECGFEMVEEFESDGQGGRLSLYQKWRKVYSMGVNE